MEQVKSTMRSSHYCPKVTSGGTVTVHDARCMPCMHAFMRHATCSMVHAVAEPLTGSLSTRLLVSEQQLVTHNRPRNNSTIFTTAMCATTTQLTVDYHSAGKVDVLGHLRSRPERGRLDAYELVAMMKLLSLRHVCARSTDVGSFSLEPPPGSGSEDHRCRRGSRLLWD
jgi:hypothetical protein